MKIAVSSLGKDASAQVDTRFGRASYFLLTDDDGASWSLLDQSDTAQMAQGAGIQTAQKMVDAGVTVVITGHVGPKAFSVLGAAGVNMFGGAQGTVKEAFAAYRQGTLTELNTSDVKGHWGQGGR